MLRIEKIVDRRAPVRCRDVISYDSSVQMHGVKDAKCETYCKRQECDICAVYTCQSKPPPKGKRASYPMKIVACVGVLVDLTKCAHD